MVKLINNVIITIIDESTINIKNDCALLTPVLLAWLDDK